MMNALVAVPAESHEYAGNDYFQKTDNQEDGTAHMGLLPMQGQHRPGWVLLLSLYLAHATAAGGRRLRVNK